jgi:CP family cyanate transporter-like MFS transporter
MSEMAHPAVPTRAGRPVVATGRRGLWIGGALVLVALNLRLAVTSVPPVLDDIRDATGLSSTGAGLLTMLPILCMGVFAPFAPPLARRLGEDGVLLLSLAGLAVGVVVRADSALAALFVGTFVAGAAIGVMNVMLPVIIKRDFERPGRMMGVYTTALSISAALAAGLTVPVQHAVGDSWPRALAFWTIPAVTAALAWVIVSRAAKDAPARESSLPSTPNPSVWRSPTARLVTAYMGIQSMMFYSLISWVPDILKSAGATSSNAGAMLSIAMFAGLPASLAVPVWVERHDTRSVVCAAAITWLLGLFGLLLSPGSAAPVWMLLIGLGQGASIALALTLIVIRSPNRTFASALSGMAQMAGYLLAAFGPLIIGVVHSISGDWKAPVIVLVGGALVQFVAGIAVSTDRGHAPRVRRAGGT